MSDQETNDIPATIPPPWTLKGTVYSFLTYTNSKSIQTTGKETFLYSPLEARSSFAQGKFLGGLGMVQVIRYTESPAGPYDELLIVPGKFEYEVEKQKKDGKIKSETKSDLRLTRIYVSQKHTCFNGRKNWNIPKHLARFTFTDLPNNAIEISVWPHDNDPLIDLEPSSKVSPFFKAIYKPIPYLPAIPLSTTPAKYLGLEMILVQPPLPGGASAENSLVGTKEWCSIKPAEYSPKASLGWWDMRQGDGKGEGGGSDGALEGEKVENENFWPGGGRWRIGIKMEEAIIGFPEGGREGLPKL